MEKFFTLTKFYNTGKGLTHLKHALRDKYDTEKIPEPKVAILKFENGQLKEASKEEIYQAYEYNKLHRYRQKNNLYFEQVISKYDFNKLPELGKYLSTTLKADLSISYCTWTKANLTAITLYFSKIQSMTKHHAFKRST